jgi:hypothetical protein
MSKAQRPDRFSGSAPCHLPRPHKAINAAVPPHNASTTDRQLLTSHPDRAASTSTADTECRIRRPAWPTHGG